MKMIRLALILMFICVVASGILAFTYKITKSHIEFQETSKEKASLSIVVPEANDFILKKVDSIDYYEAIKAGKLIGYVIPIETQGYSGLIKLQVGIDKNGIISGIVVLSQNETPGLGSKISEVRSGEKSPWFTDQFKGKSAKNLELSKTMIQAITGATISSRAVLDGVSKKVSEFLGKIK